MLLFCGTRTLCSKNEETKVCVFFCVINSGKVEKWLTPILKGHVATCFGALFHKILVVIPWVYYVSLISPLSSTSDLEFVYQISHFFDLRISDTCSTCCVLPISCLMCFFYDIRCQVSLSVPLILNEQQRAAVAHAASQQLTLVPEMHMEPPGSIWKIHGETGRVPGLVMSTVCYWKWPIYSL